LSLMWHNTADRRGAGGEGVQKEKSFRSQRKCNGRENASLPVGTCRWKEVQLSRTGFLSFSVVEASHSFLSLSKASFSGRCLSFCLYME
jgi:hypothetical protein